MADQYFRGRRVSASVYSILMEAERRLSDRGGVALNSGRRTRADQERLIREQGLYNAITNPHGAAEYSPDAPHVWEGRENHACDIDQFVGAGIAAVRETIAAMAREKGLGEGWALTVSTEPWHTQDHDERQVIALGQAYEHRPTILDRLRQSPLLPGSKSPDVIAVQIWLRRAGLWHGQPAKDIGTYGPALHRAVIAFQQKHHLRVDGKVGPKTAAALRRRYGWRVWSRRRRHRR